MKSLLLFLGLITISFTFSSCDIGKKGNTTGFPGSELVDVEDFDSAIGDLNNLLGNGSDGTGVVLGEETEELNKDSSVDSVEEVILPKKSALASCLKNKGVKFYKTVSCDLCQDQEELFGKDALAFLEIVNCKENKQACIDAGIRGYPTWIINGEILGGIKKLDFLAEKSECNFN